jgi:hypothetical protein
VGNRRKARRQRKAGAKAEARRKEKQQQRRIDAWIWKKWHAENWENYADMAHCCNQKGQLPPGCTGGFDANYIRHSIDRTRKSERNAGKTGAR